MARHHVGFGLCGLFVVFLAVLIFVPKTISGFNDMSIVAIPATANTPLQPKPKPQKQKRSKQSRF